MNAKIGELHHLWKGDNVGHSSLHTWLRIHYGKAYRCENKSCEGSSNKYEWANLSGEYKRDVNDFKMMCRKCHSIMDKGKYCKVGHLRTKENTAIRSDGYRHCKICRRASTNLRRRLYGRTD